MKKTVSLIVFISIAAFLSACDKTLDKYITVPDAFKAAFEKSRAPEAIVILKKEKKLLLITSDLCVISEFTVATGLNAARKSYVGDNCTPEGLYYITQVNSTVEPKAITKLASELTGIKDKKELMQKTEELRLMKKEFRRGRNSINAMNAVYLSAKDGHAKYKSKEDLGYNSYGPAFLRLNYPNADDIAYRKELIKQDKIPAGKGPGSGIAVHGTNDNASLGFDASSGCIRMKNEDLLKVLENAQKGEVVLIQ